MKHFVLFYEVADDYAKRRAALRQAHLEKAWAADPYVVNGLVKRWCVREWTTVAGEIASTPVRPGRA